MARCGRPAVAEDLTADFVYIRLHGGDKLYVSDYHDAELDRWARRIKTWSKGGTPKGSKTIAVGTQAKKIERDVYVYFDNSIEGHAAFDAIYLAKRLGIKRKGRVE